MKICLLSYRGNPFCGGQGVYVSRLGAHLAKLGHEVHGVCGPPYPDEVEGITWHKVPGLGLFAPGGGQPSMGLGDVLSPVGVYERMALKLGVFSEISAFSWRAFFEVRRLLNRHRFDILHDNQTLGWGTLPLKALGIPLLATIHHPLTVDRQRSFESPTSFGRQLSQSLFFPVGMQQVVSRRMERILTVSEASRQRIIRDFGVSASKIHVIPNGVELDLFRPRPHIPKVPGRLLYVGNMGDPNKGVRYLLEAMALIRRPCHLMVVSAGAGLPGWARDAIQRLGIAHQITFTSQVTPDELAACYAQAEVAVFPSLFEGFGLPAAEAMACGLPVVAAHGGGLPEVVGNSGLVVPTRDPKALAQAIDHLLANPEARAGLGQAARKRAESAFRWETAAQKLAGFYQEMIHAHR